MTIHNSSPDTTANAAGIPAATVVEANKDVCIEDITDIEKGGAASYVVQPQAAPVMYLTPPPPPGARQPAQAPPQSCGYNSRDASITDNIMSIALDIASLVVVSAGGGAAYGFGILYLVVSACGLYGSIVYQTGLIMMAVVGNCIKAMLTIMSLIAIGVMFDKDGCYESNGKTYEMAGDRTLLIIYGVFLILSYLSAAIVNAILVNDIKAGNIRNPNKPKAQKHF